MTNLLKSDSKRAQALRFIIVGAAASAIQYGCYLALLALCAMAAPVASMVSYAVSMVCNYFMSSAFTFHSRPSVAKALRFAASHAVNFVLQTLLVAGFACVMGAGWALLAAMGICIPVNFVLVRLSLASGGIGAGSADNQDG